MSAPSPPPDNSLQIAEMQRKEAKKERERQEAEKAKRIQEISGLRTNSANVNRDQARSYFEDLGLDPNAYGADIDARINQIMSTIDPEDANPGAYFDNVGQSVYDSAQTNARNRAVRSVDPLFGASFERAKIADTVDDPFIDQIYNEQRSSADAIIENMLKRGVITAPGSNSARADLDRQSAGVRTILNDLGGGLISSGRDKLKGVADRARSDASNLNLGTNFDANIYGADADRELNEFLGSFGDQFRSRIPTDLFETGGLAAIAGSGMGAQNTKFDPAALGGMIQPEDEDDPFAPKKKKEDELDLVF